MPRPLKGVGSTHGYSASQHAAGHVHWYLVAKHEGLEAKDTHMRKPRLAGFPVIGRSCTDSMCVKFEGETSTYMSQSKALWSKYSENKAF